ncbi:MAG TPA: DUF4956 domain-containing protein [Blastocatellia bacterium]|nr:DUF4956 domain-containing protein [Blastocatellia bacterium]
MNGNRASDRQQEEEGADKPAVEQDTNGWAEIRSGAQETIRRAYSLARERIIGRVSSSNSKRILTVAGLVACVVVVVVLAYLLMRGSPKGVQSAPRQGPPSAAAAQTPPSNDGHSSLTELLGLQGSDPQENETWPVAVAKITFRLALAALLTAVLAFRPRRDLPIFQRNPYVAQTQILLAVVAAALMMIVSDNAARAFGIFAAASLVRFRTNIRDPKEITVLLISLAIGLASGVGKIQLALILSVFVLLMLSLLEYFEPEQVFRAMELTVATRKIDDTDEILREVFEKRNITSELRQMDREDPDNPIAKIVYYVNVSGELSTDKLSEEIFASDPENIDSIQWDQKKTSSYVYR